MYPRDFQRFPSDSLTFFELAVSFYHQMSIDNTEIYNFMSTNCHLLPSGKCQLTTNRQLDRMLASAKRQYDQIAIGKVIDWQNNNYFENQLTKRHFDNVNWHEENVSIDSENWLNVH